MAWLCSSSSARVIYLSTPLPLVRFIVLLTPLKTALEYFGSILDAVETGNFEIAFETIPVLKEDAMKAFHHMDDEKKISIENFKECSKTLKLRKFSAQVIIEGEKCLLCRKICMKTKYFLLAKL